MANKIIVMTGGSSGFGRFTIKKLCRESNIRIILGARNGKSVDGVEVIVLDLSNLTNVCSFANDVIKTLCTSKIDALILNAGTNVLDVHSCTADGFETTFAVNHLAHYLLIRLLLPHMAVKSTIVVTSSGTHDPDEKTIIAPPQHANAFLLAYPEKDTTLDKHPSINAGRAYSSSKLCNILTVRFLISYPVVKTNQINVVAYDPGPTPGTGLARNNNIAVRIVWKILSFSVVQTFLPHFNSRKASGETLADIALGKVQQPTGYFYVALRKGKIIWKFPSKLAMNDLVMETLWKDSSRLVKMEER